jgi:hypothetical protein
VNAAGVRTVNPSKDAHVRSGTYAKTNYGTAKTLWVRDHTSEYQAFMAFPISDLGSVSGATLRLYGKLNAPGSVSVRVYAVADTTWKESGSGSLNWNSKPATGSLLGTVAFSETANSWKTLNVGAYVAGRKSAGAAYVCFGLTGAAVTTPVATLISRNSAENAGRPELVLNP